MGEITEALRRARQERPREEGRPGEGGAAEVMQPTPRPPEVLRPEQDLSNEKAPRPVPPRPDGATVEISRAKSGAWMARSVLVEHPFAECFRQFAIRVRLVIEARPNPIVLVTSALPREGKTTVACNLALALASMAAERRVALVDLDLHRPGVAAALGILPSVGLERALDGEASLASARICTDIPALDVFAIRTGRSHAHDVFSSLRFRDFAAELVKGYDAVVVDTPPVLSLPDVSLISPHVGSCIGVVRAGDTPRSAFREMLTALPEERWIGCFLNETTRLRRARYVYDLRDPHDPAADASAAG